MPTPSPAPRPTLSASLFCARGGVVGASAVLEDSGMVDAELVGVMRLVGTDVGEVFVIVAVVIDEVADEITELELGESVMNIEPLSK
jgi:hypothetical protein